MATNFLAYSSWSLSCTGMQDNVPGDCNSGLATLITYVYENVFPESAPSLNDTDRMSQVSASCITCAPRLFNATVLNSTLPAGDPATCPLMPGTSLLSTATARVGAFACATDAGETQGACVRNVTLALQNVTSAPNLLQRVRSFDPNLRFTGPTLAGLCEQLMDSRVPSPTRGSCCLRSWAYLMAGLAQQACAPELANEYLALTGRCEALLGREAPAFCVADWERLVLPLLQAPLPSRCAALPSPSPVSVAPLNPILPWLYGTACGSNQLARAACGSACDLWCGLVAASTEPGDNASPSPRGSSSDDDSLRVSTLVIICVFSVLILVVLLVLLYWACAAYRERRQGEREQFSLVLEPNMIVAGIDDGGGGTAAAAFRGLSGTKGVSGGGGGGGISSGGGISGGGSLPISASARAAPPGLVAPATAIVAGSAAAAAMARASNAPPRSSMQGSTGISTPHGPLTTSEPGSPGRSSRGTPAQAAVQQRYQPGVYGLSPSMQWRAGSAVDEPSPKTQGPVYTMTRTEAETAGSGIVGGGGGGQPSTPRYGPGAAAAAAAAAAVLRSPSGGDASSAEVTPVRPDPPTAPTVNITDGAGEYGPVITFSPAASPETVAAAAEAAAAVAASQATPDTPVVPATPDTPVVPAGPPPVAAATTAAMTTTAASPPPAVGRSAMLGFSTPPRPVVHRTGLPLTPAAAPTMPRAAGPPPLPLPPHAVASAPPPLAASGSGSQGVSPFVLMASASAGAAAAAAAAATGGQAAAAPAPTAAANPAPAPATLATAPPAAAVPASAAAPEPATGAGTGAGAAAAGAAVVGAAAAGAAAAGAAAAVAEGQQRQEADPALEASGSGGSSGSAALAAPVAAAAAAAGAGPSDSVTTSNLTAAAVAVAALRSHQLRHSDSQETFYSVQDAFNSGSNTALSRDSVNSYVTARSVPGSAHGPASAGGGTSAHSLGGGLSPAGPGTAVHSGALSPVNQGGVGVGMSNLGPGAGAGALVLQPQGSGGGGGAQGAPLSGEAGAAGGGSSQQQGQGQQQQGQGQGHARRMSDLPTVQED